MYSQPPAPVVLTWPDPDVSIPSVSPPAYDAAQVPLVPVNYEFSPQGFNTLLLLPPPNAQNTRPQYHISVALNCINPFSFITTVRRGASDTGPYVGEFEMGISTIPGTVVMADRQMKIKEAIRNDSGSRWTWRFRDDPTQHIRWQLIDSSTNVSNCFFASEPHPASTHVKIAQFKGVPVTQRGTERTAPSMLRVYPTGQALFDDILMSALILERRRLQPPAPKTHQMDGSMWWS